MMIVWAPLRSSIPAPMRWYLRGNIGVFFAPVIGRTPGIRNETVCPIRIDPPGYHNSCRVRWAHSRGADNSVIGNRSCGHEYSIGSFYPSKLKFARFLVWEDGQVFFCTDDYEGMSIAEITDFQLRPELHIPRSSHSLWVRRVQL